jgi:hypothetical protein
MATNNNTIVISFSIAILLLLTLLLLISYNSKCQMDNVEKFYSNLDEMPNTPHVQSVGEIANRNIDVNMPSKGIGNYQASDPLGNEIYNPVEVTGGNTKQPENQSCFPRDRLTANDLLPKDAANSKWAQLNPSGAGDIQDQNYLTAGYHIGINTVGQSLRNANLQLRSEIPNPQQAPGPWMISTITPDIRAHTLEIGSSPVY